MTALPSAPCPPIDVLRVPITADQGLTVARVRPLVVKGVRETTAGMTYCLHDQNGPVILIRQARLRWLQERFERELQDSVG